MADLPGLTANDLSVTAVRSELEKVLASKSFAGASRSSRFLRYVVDQTLEGHADTLKEYKLGLEVFDRGDDFDPRVDSVVRVEARQVRFKLADYYSGPGSDDEIVITLPKGGYAAKFDSQLRKTDPSRLVALKTQPQLPGPPLTRRVSKRGVVVAVTGLVLAAVGGVWLWKNASLTLPPSNSIAVLPFANLSSDPRNQYFSDGLTDEITGELSRIKELRVIARSSAFQFRGKDKDVTEVGKQLGVATILEGSVERYGDRVKIVARLERVSDGAHMWARTYERQTKDLFDVQSELAEAIAANLRGSASAAVAPRRIMRDEIAHDAYMHARFELEQGSPEAVLQAQSDFQEAIDRDPTYAAAYAGLGSARYNLGSARFNSKFSDQKGSEEMWQRALTLDSTLEEAHCGLAMLAMQYDWDWARAETEVRAALESGPSARADLRYATILVFQHRFAEADEHLLRSQEIDPVGVRYMLMRGQMWILEKRAARARAEVQKVLAEQPGNVQAQSTMSSIDLYEGHFDLALTRMQRLAEQAPSVRVLEAVILGAEGHREEALRIIHMDESNYETGNVPMASFASAYASIGDVPNTVKWLERSADRHEWQALSIAVNGAYEKMQNEPGIRALKQRMHLLAE